MNKFSEALGELDDKYISEAISYQPRAKGRGWMKWAACAACLALVCAVGVRLAGRQKLQQPLPPDQLPLSDRSANVTVRYADPNQSQSSYIVSSNELVHFTEEELFARHNTAIFKGTVAEINNIEVKFATHTTYRAIAEIEVETVYRGPCAAGDRLSVLLPCPIAVEGLWVEDTDIVSQLRTGMTGIFMPVIYNEDSTWGQDGTVLALKDIADCGFLDGVRYAFLETKEGLEFSRWSYQSIADAMSLDEVEAYILDMIGE